MCSRYGHLRDRCWEDDRNENRLPEELKSILRTNDDEDAPLVSFDLITIIDQRSESNDGEVPSQGTATNFDFDSSDDNMSFDYTSPTPSKGDNAMSKDSFYTDIGDEVDMLNSPGATVDAPIDLT